METVAVQLTGRGVGAIAVVLVAGRGVREFLRRCWGASGARGMAVGGIMHSVLLDLQRGVAIDDIVVCGWGRERYELQLHGGVAVVEMALECWRRRGRRLLLRRMLVAGGLFLGELAGRLFACSRRAQSMSAGAAGCFAIA